MITRRNKKDNALVIGARSSNGYDGHLIPAW
jgi:hypothetical protein